LATKITDKDNHRLHLQELEALDKKRLQAQQQNKFYQAQILKAFNKKVKERIFQKKRFGLSCQTTYGHDIQVQR